MRIRRYDPNFSRRKFMTDAAKGVLSTGVLMPLWDAMAADGDVTKAYPDELLSIEVYTKGQIKPGDTIDATNVHLVKDLLEPVRYMEISTMGRKLKMAKTTTDMMRLSPWDYIHATMSNKGKATWDKTSNIVVKDTGKPWIGGNPFPDPKTAKDLLGAQTLSWGRHDAVLYAVKFTGLDERGKPNYEYTGCWVDMQTVGRVTLDPKPYIPKFIDNLRYQSVFFLTPQAQRGTSFLNIWYYDQNKMPLLYGYLPQFRRVRQFPTNQRFEPLIPGLTLYLSDAWAAGDPLNTWGDFKIVGRGPFLAGLSGNWAVDNDNWQHKVHGGPSNKSFWDTTVELVPEAIIVEAKPTSFPRAPESKRRIWFDARNQVVIGMVTYDRRGKPFHSFDGAYSLYESGGKQVMDGKHPYWSWTQVISSNVQTQEITRFEQVKQLPGGYHSGANESVGDIYDKYLTRGSLMRLGTV